MATESVRSIFRPLPGLGFLALWLMVGFVAGTILLLGPVRWFVELSRDGGWPGAIERAGVIVFIAVLFVGSAVAAYQLVYSAINTTSLARRLAVTLIPPVLAALAVRWWMQPAHVGGMMGREVQVERFTYGPYPNEARMRHLKRQGYTIISLLHPAVVPFEPTLLTKEKEAAKRTGIRLISVPMLPWVSANDDALRTLRALAQQPDRYYVHCYLGRDRIRIVQRLLGHDVQPRDAKRLKGAGRTLEDMGALERGDVYELGNQGWLIGYPTDEEFLGFVLDGSVRQVVALLDPKNPRDARWIRHEAAVLRHYGMPFLLIPLTWEPYDPAAVMAAVAKTRDLPTPFVVHGFLSPSTGRAPVAEGFLQSFRSNRPSLPPSLFVEPMMGGKARVVAPHIAIGPRPMAHEFPRLQLRGVRKFIFLGDARSSDGITDQRIATYLKLPWTAMSDPEQLIGALRTGGPYYVYGDLSLATRLKLRFRYGPAIPRS